MRGDGAADTELLGAAQFALELQRRGIKTEHSPMGEAGLRAGEPHS